MFVSGDRVRRIADGSEGTIKQYHAMWREGVWVRIDGMPFLTCVCEKELELIGGMMRVEMLAVTPNAEKLIEEAGRVCWGSDDKVSEHSADYFIRGLIKKGHESVLEHASATFKFTGVSRAMTHQLVRHRIASYSQESQRWVEVDSLQPVVPSSIQNDEKALQIFSGVMDYINTAYHKLRELKILPEDARFLLPNATPSVIVMTANMREWRSVFKLRLERHAQWEIKRAMGYVLEELKKVCPNIFYDIEVDDNGNLKG